MKTVTIIQRVLPHYRISFFKKLQDNLLTGGIGLRLVYGQEYPGSVPKTVSIDEPWAIKIHNKYLRFPRTEFVWQPCLKYIKNSDLIIIEQANRLLVNYLLLSRLVAKGSKIAFWGHGKNLQSANPDGLKETFKKTFVNNVDWWFAYTGMSANFVEENGFSHNRITIVNNSIDTVSLDVACKDINEECISKVKRELGIYSENVCVYCGGMYSDKKLHFLFESCVLLKEKITDFQMIFIGDGPLQQLVSDTCNKYLWMHYIGPKFGNEKVPYLKAAKAILMPALVGLVIIDSFVVGVPLITTNMSYHGPEIAYLVNNNNGIITDFEVGAYATGVAKYLQSPEMQYRLKKGCVESFTIYSIDNMVKNFVSGVTSCFSLDN